MVGLKSDNKKIWQHNPSPQCRKKTQVWSENNLIWHCC